MITAGAVVDWLVALGLLPEAAALDRVAGQVASAEGVAFVPALQGLGTPHFDDGARGLLGGLTRGSTAAHVVRAVLEGLAQRCVDLCDALELAREQPLRVDGGLARSDLLLQRLADLSGRPVLRAAETETTALGAAFLAGLGAGVYDDASQLCRARRPAQALRARRRAGSSRAAAPALAQSRRAFPHTAGRRRSTLTSHFRQRPSLLASNTRAEERKTMSRRDEIRLSDEEIRNFLASRKTVIVCSNGPRGFPHTMPMWFAVGRRRHDPHDHLPQEPEGEEPPARPAGNPARRRTASTTSSCGAWCSTAKCEIVDDIEVVKDTMVRITAREAGDDPAALEGMKNVITATAEKRVCLLVRPERIVSWDHRKLGGAY